MYTLNLIMDNKYLDTTPYHILRFQRSSGYIIAPCCRKTTTLAAFICGVLPSLSCSDQALRANI